MEEDQGSDEEFSQFPDFKPSYVLIAIDTHSSMFIKNEDGTTPFSMALDACCAVADSLIFEQNRSKFSQFAMVFADEDSKASLVDFKDNVLDTVKLLKQKKELSKDDQEDLYARKGAFDLAAFFLLCKKKFISVSSKYYSRTVIYITNDEDPVAGDPQKRYTALNEVKSFESNGITFEMICTRHDFKYEVFYNELFSLLDAPSINQVAEDEEGLVEKLQSIIITRYSVQQLSFYPFKDEKAKYLPIVRKDLMKAQKLFNNARMSRDGQQVKRVVRNVGNQAPRFTLKGFSEIQFDFSEKKELKESNVPVGLTLLHVSNRLIEPGMVFTKSSLIELDDKNKENLAECRKLFDEFWQYCYNKDKVLICARKLRKTDGIRFVELIPKFALDKRLFLMKAIPFQNEVRLTGNPIYQKEYTKAQAEVVDALVDKLSFDYEPTMFPDLSYAIRKAYIKSKLLDEPMEQVYDDTQVTAEMDESIKDIVVRFKSLFGLFASASQNKRKGSAGRGSAAKKLK